MSDSSFDPEQYLAANPDLINAFGFDTDAAERHYETFGKYEDRSTTFDSEKYLASNPDLLVSFGDDTKKATEHYIEDGYKEGRHSDFDPKKYVASNPDLIIAFGNDTKKATEHYIQSGYREGRKINFDASKYLSSNADLSAAFGGDTEKATEHYIEYGYSEHRHLETNETDSKFETSVTTTTSTVTGTVTGGLTSVTGTDLADRYVATSATRFEGKGGGDNLKLVEHANADQVVYSSLSDGGAGGAKTGYDEIKNFQTGTDTLILTGSIRTALDHNSDSQLSSVIRSTGTLNLSTDELVVLSGRVDGLISDNMEKIRQAIGNVSGTGDALVLAQDEEKSGLYAVHGTGVTGIPAASSIRLLAVFNDGSLSARDVFFG
ncbi:hypothetical protein [Azospirillum sp.]|uniref:hypothetical protein n=1 Tax=Azospirillum sp. TaxID=34012 RepID=UPI0026120F35|nr:hypothetical protein [Azospirillum sp.]